MTVDTNTDVADLYDRLIALTRCAPAALALVTELIDVLVDADSGDESWDEVLAFFQFSKQYPKLALALVSVGGFIAHGIPLPLTDGTDDEPETNARAGEPALSVERSEPDIEV